MEYAILTAEQLTDHPDPHTVESSRTVHHGAIWDVCSETFRMVGQEKPLTREFITHPGAVSVVVLDEHERILLINQYRHPVRQRMWEIPAGLLDVCGEPALQAAQRELGEEADLTARTWHTLVDFDNSPGSSAEANRIFLARDLDRVPESERFERDGEEAEIVAGFADLDDALSAVMAGRITSPAASLGILATQVARSRNWATLRAPDAEWTSRPRHET